MAEKSRKEQHDMWQGRLELATRFLEKYGDTNERWTENVKAMAGDYGSDDDLGDERVDVHTIRANVKSTLPPLYITEPHIAVKPTVKTFKGADNVFRAEKVEVELNYWLRELKVRHQVKKIVHDGEATNVGYAYIGYIADDQDAHFDWDPLVKPGNPMIKRISPRQVKLPPGYDEPEQCPWISLEFRRPKSAVVEKFGLTDEQADNLPTEDYDEEMKGTVSDQFTAYFDTDDAKLVRVNNIWDKQTKKVYIIVPKFDDFLHDPKDWPFDLGGFPIERYSPEYVPDEMWATPPLSYLMTQAHELNAARTAMAVRHNRNKGVKLVSGLDKEVIERWTDARDGSVIDAGVEEDTVPLANRIHTDVGLPPDEQSLVYEARIKDDIQEQSVGSGRRGNAQEGVSATAEANVEKGIQIRESDRADNVKTLYLGIARKLWMVLQRFPNKKRTRLIAGPLAGELTELEITAAEMHGEFTFTMDLGAAVADNPQVRETRATIRYNLLRADPRVNPDKLVLDLLRAQQVDRPEDYLLTLKTPSEEHQIMTQLLPVEAHERDDHEQHLQMHEIEMQMIDDALAQMGDTPNPEVPGDTMRNSAMGRKFSAMQILLIAHFQHHIKLISELTGQPGQPISENLLRNNLQSGAGGETGAELLGQPLTSDQVIR
jgi:hypothetical protein